MYNLRSSRTEGTLVYRDANPRPKVSEISHATTCFNSRLRSAICRHHPPQRAVLSQICCFGERKVVLFQILLDGAKPRDAGRPSCLL